jgi:lipoprotein-releasing system permease protein
MSRRSISISDGDDGGRPGIVLGSELADRLGAEVGDEVLSRTLWRCASVLGFAPKSRPFGSSRCSAPASTPTTSSLGFVSIPRRRSSSSSAPTVTGIEIKLRGHVRLVRVGQRLLDRASPRLRATMDRAQIAICSRGLKLEKAVMS